MGASAFTGPQTRAELIDEYVVRDAWTSILRKVADATYELFEKEGEAKRLEDIHNAICQDALGAIEDELWDSEVTDNPGHHPEYDDAVTRAIALQAAILGQLTTAEAQEELRRESARLAKLAADRFAKA